jgi:hypothetical protein
MPQDVVEALVRPGRRLADVGQQCGEFLDGQLQRRGEPRVVPRLWLGLGAFQPHHGGAVDTDNLGEALLAEPDGPAPVRQPVPPARHDLPSVAVAD